MMIDAEHILADALTVCAIAAPTGQEEARAAYVRDRLLQIPDLTASIDAVGNVVAHLPAAAHTSVGTMQPATIVAAHLDTVFGAEVELRPYRDGDVLRGPGIGDNALAVATLLALARALAGRRLERALILAATVGEEGLGNLRGARALLAAIPARYLIALEGHGVDHLVTEAVGSVRLAVTYTGPGGHSWGDRGAPSALHALARAVARMGDAVAAALPEVSVNVGVFHGGTGVNVIAARAELQLDLRALAPDALRRAEALARTIFAAEAKQQRVTATIEPLGHRPAGSIAQDHALVQAAQQARLLAGLPAAEARQGSTDANAAYERGVPAVTLGISRGGNTHRTDEYIEVAPVGAGARAALNLLLALAGATP
jgi:acetylornithine deacetylase/succinyl-diaminopimelate desuccinylase-like protein